MAEEKIDGTTWQRLLPWTTLFRTFQITLDLNKLLLAAGGIVVMWLSWWLLALIFFFNPEQPKEWSSGDYQAKKPYNNENDAGAWKEFRRDLDHFNLMYEATGRGPEVKYTLEDVVDSPEEYAVFKKLNTRDVSPGPPMRKLFADEIERRRNDRTLSTSEANRYQSRLPRYELINQPKPAGRLNINPWSEDRGPNPYLLVTGQAGIPWEASSFGDWFLRDQLPVMLEPLIKLGRPIVYFLSPRNTFWSRVYFFLVITATVLTWSFFGGAITRIAAVQLARGERIGLIEAMRFSAKRILSFLLAPVFPLAVVGILTIILAIFGLIAWLPWLGEILVGGVFWFVPLLFGLLMAMALVGLVGWPLMIATISTEGTDSWEAVTRSYGYVYQRPWHCAWYALLSVAYGGLVIFFIGFMGSLTVYLAKWGVGQIVTPTHLFVYAPTSFGWRELLLEGATVPETTTDKAQAGAEVVASRAFHSTTTGTIGGISRWSRINQDAYRAYVRSLDTSKTISAYLVAFWLGLAFLLVLAFGYVFFWTASTITYFLLRKSLESAEMDEVYLEEEDYEAKISNRGLPSTPAPAPAAPKAASLPVVEAPPAAAIPTAHVAPVGQPAPAEPAKTPPTPVPVNPPSATPVQVDPPPKAESTPPPTTTEKNETPPPLP